MKIKTLIILAITLITPVKSWAELSQGMENDLCYKQSNNDYHKAHDCLLNKKNEIFAQHERIADDTNKRILKNYDGPVFNSNDPDLTIGMVYSKYFLDSQKSWKAYRKNLCLGVASEIGEDTYDYQPSIDQCEINLTKNHIKEIMMMDIPVTH